MQKPNDPDLFAFIGFVNFQSHVIWDGKIRSTWALAKGTLEVNGQIKYYNAVQYIVTLRYLGGKSKLALIKCYL